MKKNLQEAVSVLKGKTPPGRAFALHRDKSGKLIRKAIAAEVIQKNLKEEWDSRQVNAAREQLALTQRQFADLLGVSIDTLQNWEQGRRTPTGAARILLRIARTRPEIILQAA